MNESGLAGRILAVFATAALGFLVWSHDVAAEESGSFRLIQSFVRDYTTIEHDGIRITGGSVTGTSTVLESSGDPFVEGASEIVTCVVLARTSQAGVDLEAPCTVTGDPENSWYFVARRDVGDIKDGGGGDGRAELSGGTRKYAGVNGICAYSANYLRDGQQVAFADCTWNRP